MNELDKLLEDDVKNTQVAPLEKTQDELDQELKNNEAIKKEEELTNLQKAIAEAQTSLKSIRDEKKRAKGEVVEDELPKIDMEDPSSKAWDKHIRESVNPLQDEVNVGKDERRKYALSQFLKDKPNLAKNPEKVKELMLTYEKIRTASEMTTEGISFDLDKAYAATFSEELIDMARGRQVAGAKADALFADIAVSRGATSYSVEKEKNPTLSEEDKRILAKWGQSPEEWADDYKNHKA